MAEPRPIAARRRPAPGPAARAPAAAARAVAASPAAAPLALRPPAEVMRLARMGLSFPTRLSFSRQILRRLSAERTRVVRRLWQMDGEGYGRAVYSLRLGGREYSLVAFSSPLSEDRRTDRVIAEAWDATFALRDGVPSAAALARLQESVPRQEAGRYDDRVLVLSRANKSARLFAHVVSRLAAGEQPDADKIRDIGYLMRTTAVYGNGKFGIADRAAYADRPPLSAPFQAELLAVWLIRGFTHDLAEHVARRRGGAKAAVLSPRFRRYLGVGNATGLGMAPFLANHPLLIHNWTIARETALARVFARGRASPPAVARMRVLAERAAAHLAQWRVGDSPRQSEIAALRQDWRAFRALLAADRWQKAKFPWRRLFADAGGLSPECRELIAALLLEQGGDEQESLAAGMAAGAAPPLRPAMTIGRLRGILARHCGWALDVDFSDRRQEKWFWHMSAEKAEPRLGDRHSDGGAEWELPLDVARRLRRLADDLADIPAAQTLAEFLAARPEHRPAARRAQTLAEFPYSEIRDNLIGEDCRPIDMLRWKLSFLGAAKFDPKSDLWTRVAFFQGAPVFDDIAAGAAAADDWWLPALEEGADGGERGDAAQGGGGGGERGDARA